MDKRQKNNKEDFILFATADWNTPYWTNKQHMAKEFAKFGHRVLYIESIGLRKLKIASGTDWKRVFFRLLRGFSAPKNVDQNIWVLSPLVFPYSFKHSWIKKFNLWIIVLQIKRFKEMHNFVNPYLWTYHPYIMDLIKKLKFSNKLIYHCVDDLAAVPGIDKKAFNLEEKKFLIKADLIFVTSKSLEQKCKLYNANTYYFPNVVDFEHFSYAQKTGRLPKDIIQIPEPRIVYMGALSEFKINFQSVLKLIESCPKYSFIFMGDEIEGQDSKVFKKILTCSNVHFLGFKNYEELPDYLRGMQLGIIPLMVNNYTRSISPMKFFEYIASGLPVASLNFQYPNVKSKKITYSNTVLNFIESVKMLAKADKLTFSETKKLVGNNTWSFRTKKMLALIKK